jgi:hypothetical protein
MARDRPGSYRSDSTQVRIGGEAMTTSAKGRLACAALLWLPGLAWGWGGVAAGTATPIVLAQADARQQAPDERADEGADPTPPPPEAVPAPPAQRPQAPGASQAPPARAGQWVHTDQYGWIWMPYGDAYTYAPPDGYGEPYAYVYAPAYGWTWLVAPWVWGFGPWPYFGVHGPFLFAWYGHGWWRSPWRFHFAGGFRGGFVGHRGFAPHGWRAAPARGGWAGRGAPGGRGFAVHGGGGGGGGRGGGHGRR